MSRAKNYLLLIAVILCLPAVSDAQWYTRIEVGYNYVMASAQYSGYSAYYDGMGNLVGDSATKRNIKATAGLGYDFGFTIPIKRVSKRGSWGLSIHAVYNGFIWDNLNQGVTASGGYFNVTGYPDLYGATVQLGLPVGIEYKNGPDAVSSKKYHFGFSVGAGVFPTYNVTELIGIDNAGAGAGMSVNPFVKGEVSLFAGICFKLRAQYSFLDVPYIDQNKNDLAFTSGPFKVTGTSHLMLSFIVMPFSWRWKPEEWWNNYGKYNPYL